ncbi:hypothetical protein PTTG_03430 [Puccinia triticina 1-1 BBBD Race 1]|uniref:RING-type domain-containing protein n=2 Tax=Puccinia triticina TaxID=208348 RepID=A0A0C4ERL1_PUCT1|nr:uncharacterized protein PtA15_7A703 [Puccinia triticina]OAV96195.1 hypothetical protein PTTG_03430 [Puccinia triticina 1-1 BBBD Race 1]WAQ86974.1 hypothetical protein PtA15_7A703 [Puccinia triticina]WAR56836.1 hypothetical protein PtB15_7B687 [Puccinia triticina]
MAPIELDDRNKSHPQINPPAIQKPGESKTQTIHRLAAELKVAKMAKTHAERKVLELEDVIRQRAKLMDISSQQCDAAWENMAELKNQIASQDVVIKRLKDDANQYPLSSSTLVQSHQRLSSTIDTLRECFTCPLCYNGLEKGDAVSLRCGHTFCQKCIDAWAASSNPSDSRPQELRKTAEARVQCPECRTTGSTRVRLYMMEEAIRLLARAEREREAAEIEEQARRAELEVVHDPKPTDYLAD